MLFSPIGNPIGIRLSYDITIPVSATLGVFPVLYPKEGYNLYGPLTMYFGSARVTGPDNREEAWEYSTYKLRKKGIYHIVADMVPSYDATTHSNVYFKCFNLRQGFSLERLQ